MKHMHLCYEIHKYKLTIHMCFNISQRIYSMFLVAIQPLEINTIITALQAADQSQGTARENITNSAESSFTWTRLLVISYDEWQSSRKALLKSFKDPERDVKTSGIPWHLHKCSHLLLSPLCEQLNQYYYVLKLHIGHSVFFSHAYYPAQLNTRWVVRWATSIYT